MGKSGIFFVRKIGYIVKFIDNSTVENMRFYTNLVRAQLSSNELVLLFYNALSDKGREKFKPLIEKYSLLKTVQKDKLIDPNHVRLYSESAYGES